MGQSAAGVKPIGREPEKTSWMAQALNRSSFPSLSRHQGLRAEVFFSLGFSVGPLSKSWPWFPLLSMSGGPSLCLFPPSFLPSDLPSFPTSFLASVLSSFPLHIAFSFCPLPCFALRPRPRPRPRPLIFSASRLISFVAPFCLLSICPSALRSRPLSSAPGLPRLLPLRPSWPGRQKKPPRPPLSWHLLATRSSLHVIASVGNVESGAPFCGRRIGVRDRCNCEGVIRTCWPPKSISCRLSLAAPPPPPS